MIQEKNLSKHNKYLFILSMGMGFTIQLKYTLNGSFEMKDVIIVINYMVDAKVIFKCPIDYGDFPFHSVICKLRITSFTKSNTSMVLTLWCWRVSRQKAAVQWGLAV